MDNNQGNFNNFNQNDNLNFQQNNMNHPVVESNNSDNLEKNRKAINTNTIVLLVVSIVAMIFGIISSNTMGEQAMNLFYRGFVYTILFIVILVNNKEAKKFVGGLSIFTSLVIIVWSGIGGSLIDIALIALSAFNIVYSIKYLRSFKDETSNMTSEPADNSTNYYRLGSLAIVLLSPLVWFLSALKSSTFCIVILVLMNIVSIILCAISSAKGKKSALLYILMVISILIVVAYGLVIVTDLITGKDIVFGE